MNINDPADVKALLEQLRSSQAWQQLASVASEPSRDEHEPPPSSSSVASLLSQLQTPATSLSADVPSPKPPIVPPSETPSPPPRNVLRAPSPEQDMRFYTFQQALSHISHMADEPDFIAFITQLKKDQDDLERQLSEDRRAIYRKHEEKVKVAVTKAKMISGGRVPKHEADMLQHGLRKELEHFDRERVLCVWDGLISKQQSMLAARGVPTMFVTEEQTHRERQQRVAQVLEGLARS